MGLLIYLNRTNHQIARFTACLGLQPQYTYQIKTIRKGSGKRKKRKGKNEKEKEKEIFNYPAFRSTRITIQERQKRQTKRN